MRPDNSIVDGVNTMKSIILSSLWRRSGIVSISAVLGVCLWGVAVRPAIADEYHNTIARNILNLQQSQERWIEIDLTEQRLVAWEGSQPVYAIVISTGKESTPTLPGAFAIQSKHEVARMQGADYDVPDVPFTMYYYGGYAIHGAYWHNNFGPPVSHGCTNVAVNHAEWLFNWADVGTPVVVH